MDGTVQMEKKKNSEMADQLSYCLGRVEQAEKALFTALSQVVDTRQTIMEIVQGSNSFREQTADSEDAPELGAVAQATPGPIIKGGTGFSLGAANRGNLAGRGRTSDLYGAIITAPSDYSLVKQAISQEQTPEDKKLVLEAGQKLGLTREDVENAHKLFMEHDVDHSGLLSVSEMTGLLQKMTRTKLHRRDVDRILQQVDLNKDNFIDFSEFLLCVCHTPENRTKYLNAAVTNKDAGKVSKKFTLRMVGLPFKAIRGYLEKEIEEMTSFLSIPVIFLLFFCFVMSSSFHWQVSVTHSFEQSIREDIENNANFGFAGMMPFENGREGFKNIYDIQAIEDFWSWMDLGLAPLFFPSGWGYAEQRGNLQALCQPQAELLKSNGWPINFTSSARLFPQVLKSLCTVEENQTRVNEPTGFPSSLISLSPFANTDKKPYRLFNEIVAGVRMKQEQLPLIECPRTDFKNLVYKTPCTEQNVWAWLRPDMDAALDMEDDLVDKEGGKTVYFKSALPLDRVKAELRNLENDRWFNPMTSKIQILLTSYNNNMDVFIATYINLLVNRAGNIHKVIDPMVLWLDPYREPAAYVTDFLMVALVLKLLIEELIELIKTIKKEGRNAVFKYFDNFKNVIDWLSILYSIMVFVLWITWLHKVSDFVELLQTANADIEGSWPSSKNIFTPSNEGYWLEVDSMCQYFKTMQYILAFYPFCIGARFFSTFSSQPRLALVTDTLSTAAKDIFHFLVVLVVTLVIFCSSAEYLFALQVEEYENFSRTFVSVFRAMLGDFDYVELTQVGRLPAALWYLAFMVLVNMIMLNMLLAIIMDVYGGIKGGMGDDEETIWSQTMEILDRWRRQNKGTAIPLSTVAKALSKKEDTLFIMREVDGIQLHEPKLITISVFLECVEGLSEDQAERLLSDAYDWWHKSKDELVGLTDLDARLRNLDLKMQRAQEVIDTITDMQEMAMTMDGDLRERILQIGQDDHKLQIPGAGYVFIEQKMPIIESAV